MRRPALGHHLAKVSAFDALRDLLPVRDRIRIGLAAFASIGIRIAAHACISSASISHEATS
jgi:uncharacterized membrane protein YeiH